MKRLIVSFFAAFMAVTVFAGDYEPGDKVFIKISVDAVQEKFFVGPYAKYAHVSRMSLMDIWFMG